MPRGFVVLGLPERLKERFAADSEGERLRELDAKHARTVASVTNAYLDETGRGAMMDAADDLAAERAGTTDPGVIQLPLEELDTIIDRAFARLREQG
jgi:hypothetical protein